MKKSLLRHNRQKAVILRQLKELWPSLIQLAKSRLMSLVKIRSVRLQKR